MIRQMLIQNPRMQEKKPLSSDWLSLWKRFLEKFDLPITEPSYQVES